MANRRISNAPPIGLPVGAALTGTELVPMDQTTGGITTTVKMTVAQIAALGGPAGPQGVGGAAIFLEAEVIDPDVFMVPGNPGTPGATGATGPSGAQAHDLMWLENTQEDQWPQGTGAGTGTGTVGVSYAQASTITSFRV